MNAGHADFATLVAYWLGELDETREAEVETHYLGCGQCAAQLAEVEALSEGVRRAFVGGHVPTAVTAAFVEQMRSRGVQLREYHVPRNGSVSCSVAPEDQMLLSYLQAPLEGVGRVDAIVSGDAEMRLEDVPFDAASGLVILSPSIAQVRTMPAYRRVVRLVAVDAGGERLVGEYTFNHSPHPGVDRT